MHLPPEVERLVPELVARVAEPGEIDADREAERIETLLIAGDPERWLTYLRDRGGMVEASASTGNGATPELTRLAAILRDQLALIQVAIDLGPGDLALLDGLERLESRRAP